MRQAENRLRHLTQAIQTKVMNVREYQNTDFAPLRRASSGRTVALLRGAYALGTVELEADSTHLPSR